MPRAAGVMAQQRLVLGVPISASLRGRLRRQWAVAIREIGDDACRAVQTGHAVPHSDWAVPSVPGVCRERRRPSAGWASLTTGEREVVELAAAGLTNPQIAAKLFMSRATVKTHLSHIYAKLGVANRTELAAKATRRALAAG